MGRMHYRVRGQRHGLRSRRLPSTTSHAAGHIPKVPPPHSARPVASWEGLRRVRPLPLAALILQWLVIAVLCLAVLDIARVAGVPIVLAVLVWTGLRFMRTPRRVIVRDPPGQGKAEAHPPAAPLRGNPYDLDTYLRRRAEDRP